MFEKHFVFIFMVSGAFVMALKCLYVLHRCSWCLRRVCRLSNVARTTLLCNKSFLVFGDNWLYFALANVGIARVRELESACLSMMLLYHFRYVFAGAPPCYFTPICQESVI